MLSHERYFVVLLACDYQALLKEQKHRLVWSARLSRQAPGMSLPGGGPPLERRGEQFLWLSDERSEGESFRLKGTPGLKSIRFG